MTTTDDELAARRSSRNGAGDDDQVHDEVPELEGQSQLELPLGGAGLSMSVGKGKPTAATFSMRSLSLPLAPGQQLELEGRLWLLVEAEVDDVGVKTHRKGRTVTARVRRHSVAPLSARVLTVDELAQLGVEL